MTPLHPFTSKWTNKDLSALMLPISFKSICSNDIKDVVPFVQSNLPECSLRSIETFDIVEPDDLDIGTIRSQLCKFLIPKLSNPSDILLLSEMFRTIRNSIEEGPELVVQEFAEQLLIAGGMSMGNGFAITRQPHPKNKISFEVGGQSVTSNLDVACWYQPIWKTDCKLVLAAKVEVKRDVSTFMLPQLLGQLVAQGAYNYQTQNVEKDGSVVTFGVALSAWRVRLVRVIFPPTYFDYIANSDVPPVPKVAIWPKDPHLGSLLSLENRKLIVGALLGNSESILKRMKALEGETRSDKIT